ncbi:hypothetical protein GRO01_10510 [Gluconobacter roseus NBRC 3990]|uniref:Uncharacterized protein n=1 Tax=Gluconobacter roseus NBRC 3990 TaxID=1307950 RepID=A0A4Y3M4C3_9PROT|nr:hypothetical protein AA3990_1944 [Gluconobacter roseus NBRC 3990]GEB03475.1 hypothetical protein GRO01_10510 [Gluconobacter roseus NBRC 3990]GLP93930.1 hypothetical protein GCM10007871_19080 [Gluconobacter roseus NBRC 3990]
MKVSAQDTHHRIKFDPAWVCIRSDPKCIMTGAVSIIKETDRFKICPGFEFFPVGRVESDTQKQAVFTIQDVGII